MATVASLPPELLSTISRLLDKKSLISFAHVSRTFKECYVAERKHHAQKCLSQGKLPLHYKAYPGTWDISHVESPEGEHLVILEEPNGTIIQGPQERFKVAVLDRPVVFDGGKLCCGYSRNKERHFEVWDLVDGTLRAKRAMKGSRHKEKETWNVLSEKHDLLVHILQHGDDRRQEISVWDSRFTLIAILHHRNATNAWVLGKEGTVISICETYGTVKIWKPLQSMKPMVLDIPDVTTIDPIIPGCIKFETRYGDPLWFIHEKPSPDEHVCAKFTDGSYFKRHVQFSNNVSTTRMIFTLFNDQNQPQYSFDDYAAWQCLTYLDKYLITAGNMSEIKVWSKEGRLLAQSPNWFWFPRLLLSPERLTIIVLEYNTSPSYASARISSATTCTFTELDGFKA
ncbi:hypothetical protein N7523_005900 [Penicillium sp. IBT 18751x]|nr:hypothetical protein N7523_005900 [Penicillium sp. IBT 18751x]